MISHDRTVRIVVTTATMLLALTVGGKAEVGHNGAHNHRDHRGEVAKPPAAKGTYNPATATVRDHRTPAGSGASAIPSGAQRK